MRYAHLFVVALVVFFPSCGVRARQVSLLLAGETFTVEVADTEELRRRGLMGRTSLGNREGMLFVFERDQLVAFWMKDTKVPLSVAYISSDGTIREIHDMEPGSLRPVESAVSVRYALEVTRGTFARLGLAPGDRIEIPLAVTRSPAR